MATILSDTGIVSLECVREILESYMEFVDIMGRTLAKCDVPPMIKTLADTLIRSRHADWQPLLDDVTRDLKNQKDKNE